MIVYNDEIIDEGNELYPFVQDVHWRYGMVVFETMHALNGQILFLKDHVERLRLGMKLLNYSNVDLIDEEWIVSKFQLVDFRNDRAVVRLAVKPNTTYSGFDYLLSVKEFLFETTVIERAIIAQNVRLDVSVLAACKTGRRIDYYLAEKEMRDKKANACILLNRAGFVSDANISNVFWVKNEVVFTSPILDGGISGIMRKNIIAHFSNTGIKARTTSVRPEELKSMDGVFLTNVVRGAQAIQQLEEHQYNLKLTRPFIEQANELLT